MPSLDGRQGSMTRNVFGSARQSASPSSPIVMKAFARAGRHRGRCRHDDGPRRPRHQRDGESFHSVFRRNHVGATGLRDSAWALAKISAVKASIHRESSGQDAPSRGCGRAELSFGGRTNPKKTRKGVVGWQFDYMDRRAGGSARLRACLAAVGEPRQQALRAARGRGSITRPGVGTGQREDDTFYRAAYAGVPASRAICWQIPHNVVTEAVPARPYEASPKS